MGWILHICTWGILGICSQDIKREYPTEESCYRALDKMVEIKGQEQFLHIGCAPATPPQTGEE